MFEKASRMRLRFASPQGLLMTEDLWDLPLIGKKACLDDIAKGLNMELKNSDQESFVLKKSKPNEELQLKFEIVKHIIAVRLQEQEVAENAQKARAKKQQILSIIAEKETEDLKGKSLDDLRALVDSL